MPVTTLSAAIHITPVVFKTFFEHSKTKARKIKNGDKGQDATDDIFFDEAFHIVKKFIELGTKNTVESLQAFTNTHVPAPYWAAVSPVSIPLISCNRAADILIEWFGPEELKAVVGGERWWQVRGLDGIDGEWITEKDYLSTEKVNLGRKLSTDDENIIKMEHLETVLLYIHGGGYFWGSINTHRYQIIRYARKIQGRAFAVNYRKAPQYPWPCPLQDVLAAYLYLIDPPPSALHKAVPPSKIVFAGDSAGGGLSITLLTILRDMGLPLPAGTVLISPWVDLTHSFPSVMENTATDIIPQHGFLAKPSTLWPVNLLPKTEDERISKASSNPPPKPGHTDTLYPSKERVEAEKENENETKREGEEPVKSQEEMLESGDGDVASNKVQNARDQEVGEMSDIRKENRSDQATNGGVQKDAEEYDIDRWEPRPPKVLMKDPKSVPLELHSQIQLYATTEQLTHPLVSPILQGSLGNLCPLYIIAGDGEVLRDEIIYLAHRAAHPQQYPTREGVLKQGRRQKENAGKYQVPTKVHLQVFDGMCHVLTVFTFIKTAKYAYRSIAEFVKHVTNHSEEHLERNPFPELHMPSTEITTDDISYDDHHRGPKQKTKRAAKSMLQQNKTQKSEHMATKSDINLYKEGERATVQEVKKGETQQMPASLRVSESSSAFREPEQQEEDIPNVLMIRQRVDIFGKVRHMEPEAEIPALQMPTAEIGLIKEAPTRRWLEGQREWDQRYHRSAEKAVKTRKKIEEKSRTLLEHAREQGLVLDSDRSKPPTVRRGSNASARTVDGTIELDRRWGPLDLDDENPPPTAIAKRRDTEEALALLRKSIYHNAPVTHKTVPKMKTTDAIRAAFDPHDDPNKAPRQSVSEQQVRTHLIPVHGLRVWDALLGYFARKSTKNWKATNGANTVVAVQNTGDRFRPSHNNGL